MSNDSTFKVGGHDFAKFSVIPSVTFVIKIPEELDGSWYEGEVHVGFKDAVLEASAIHHSTIEDQP